MNINDQISKAIEVLKQGGIVIFPTDTAFGIGCRVDAEESVQKMFSLRHRPETKATPVLVDSLAMAERYARISPEIVDSLIQPYWPGALTIVLPCKLDTVPSLVRGGGLTVGLRMPDHEATRSLITGLGVPMLGPSANFSGEETPFQLADVDPQLLTLVDYVVTGVTKSTKASTVIDVTEKPWKVLRQGAVVLAK